MATRQCVIVEKVCKTAREVRPWGFNFALYFARKWSKNTAFAAGVKARPSKESLQTGKQYSSSGGVAGPFEPRWPTAKDIAKGITTVRDGSILWTVEDISTASLFEQIVDVDWTVDSGITFDEAAPVIEAALQSTGGKFSTGTAGETYNASVIVTTSEGNEYEARLEIEIHDDD